MNGARWRLLLGGKSMELADVGYVVADCSTVFKAGFGISPRDGMRSQPSFKSCG